jgi:hypothetical protein
MSSNAAHARTGLLQGIHHLELRTRSAAAGSETSGVPSWALWLIGITFAILFIWLWNTANSAKSLARENASLLARPELEMSYLVGGPKRFQEQFTEALEDAELEGFESANCLWSTAMVSNEGIYEVDDVRLTADFHTGQMPTILAFLPSFGRNLDTEESEGGLQVSLRDIDDDEVALVFFGFDPAALPEALSSDWTGRYQTVVSDITVEADDITETLYGRGI